MTKQKAIKILQKFRDYSLSTSQNWLESSKSYQTKDLGDIARMIGEILQGDARIIQSAIDELIDSKNPTKSL